MVYFRVHDKCLEQSRKVLEEMRSVGSIFSGFLGAAGGGDPEGLEEPVSRLQVRPQLLSSVLRHRYRAGHRVPRGLPLTPSVYISGVGFIPEPI